MGHQALSCCGGSEPIPIHLLESIEESGGLSGPPEQGTEPLGMKDIRFFFGSSLNLVKQNL